MNWLKPLSLFFRFKVSAILEHCENPALVLNHLIDDLEEELERARLNVANVIADEKQIGTRVDAGSEEVRKWQERAETMIRRGDDNSARAALEQKLFAEHRFQTIVNEQQQHKAETVKLCAALRDLEQNVEQARHRRTLLLARMARADSANAINSVLRSAASQSVISQFERLEEEVARVEGVEQAYLQLEYQDAAQFEAARADQDRERQDRLQLEFEELKRRLSEPE